MQLDLGYVENVIDKLPRGSGSWKKRSIDDIKYLILHQSLGRDSTAKSINAYHIRPPDKTKRHPKAWGRGWPKAAYTFIIERDGEIKQCNELSAHSYHSGKNGNRTGIGICICGHFEGEGHVVDQPTPERYFNEPTVAQLESLERLVTDLLRLLKIDIEDITTHREIGGKLACPGFAIEQWIYNYKDGVRFVDNPIPFSTDKPWCG